MSVNERGRPIAAVTLSDVARAAGVGESTVSRVLRNHGSFTPGTRDRVLAAVARLGYVPNRIAGALASTDSNLIALVIPSLANIVFPDVLRGANAALAGTGCQTVVGVTDYDPGEEEAIVRALLAWRPRAVLIAGLEHTPGARAMLEGAGIRVAEVLDIDGEGIDIVVGFSNRAAGAAAARHLIGRGYRRLGYVGHDLERDTRAAKRLAGFREAIGAAGVDFADLEITPVSSAMEAGRRGLERLLARRPDLDAVYFSNDDMAIGGYFHCLAAGIDVPGRLALFGHNGLDAARAAPKPLTTILTPRFAAGETAVRLVLGDGPSTVVDLGFELIEGATA
ncbi:LacI family DNA-binding transcriptional regulator [Prosthecomicrobium sp. N25]|uniref:LacI family DNA-binding transcriptional regulator n=1 Tax=Prosthecomicrobium sp. N25 TaxID=3129254 RepID=UPI00307723AC